MNDNISSNPLAALQEIKKAMQQSARIFSLSGWSGIWVGIIGLLGAIAIAYFCTDSDTGIIADFSDFSFSKFNDFLISIDNNTANSDKQLAITAARLTISNALPNIFYTAIITLILAIIAAIFFSYNKNAKLGHAFTYNEVVKKLLINLSIPLLAGCFFGIALFQEGLIQFLVPTTLIFYGLALINCSKYTFTDIKYLGLIEVLLGIFALIVMQWHLYIWAFGFGVLHIIYGIVMWNKYDRKNI